MSGFWFWLFCKKATLISAALGAGGSLCLTVPWAHEVYAKLHIERRSRQAERAHEGHPLAETLRLLGARQLLQPAPAWVMLIGLLGAAGLATSFAIILASASFACPGG